MLTREPHNKEGAEHLRCATIESKKEEWEAREAAEQRAAEVAAAPVAERKRGGFLIEEVDGEEEEEASAPPRAPRANLRACPRPHLSLTPLHQHSPCTLCLSHRSNHSSPCTPLPSHRSIHTLPAHLSLHSAPSTPPPAQEDEEAEEEPSAAFLAELRRERERSDAAELERAARAERNGANAPGPFVDPQAMQARRQYDSKVGSIVVW